MTHSLDYLEHEHEQPDAWHRHTAQEGAPQAEHAAQVNTMALGLVFVVMTVSIVAIATLVGMYFQRHITELRRERVEIVEPIATPQLDYRQATLNDLSTYGWANEQAQTVRVPVESVYDTIIQEHADRAP